RRHRPPRQPLPLRPLVIPLRLVLLLRYRSPPRETATKSPSPPQNVWRRVLISNLPKRSARRPPLVASKSAPMAFSIRSHSFQRPDDTCIAASTSASVTLTQRQIQPLPSSARFTAASSIAGESVFNTGAADDETRPGTTRSGVLNARAS